MEYAAYYCEENIWRLLSGAGYQERSWAVLVFGRFGRAAMLKQKAGNGEDGFVLWDYHVVALVADPSRAAHLVLDFDTRLDFPVDATEYLDRSFFSPTFPNREIQRVAPLFRIVPAAEFTARFNSDRSHMLAPDGTWLAPPPSWESPRGDGMPEHRLAWSLSSLVDPSRESPGLLVDQDGFRSALKEGRFKPVAP